MFAKYTKNFIIFLLLFSVNVVFADVKVPVEFFASNNTGVIDLQTAFNRLHGDEQTDLQNSMIDVMQENHIEQGKFEDILGTYQISNNHKITADNTEHYLASPYQHLSIARIFLIAKTLAIKLKQDSVAVFIPDQISVGSITVSFSSEQPRISELVNMVRDKLGDQYNKAFSLRLVKQCSDFANTKVAAIEWLGSTMNVNEVKRAFPSEKINVRHGKVYLVYKDGRVEML